MIDAIDTDMHARPGDAELIPWLLVLDCAPQHVAKECPQHHARLGTRWSSGELSQRQNACWGDGRELFPTRHSRGTSRARCRGPEATDSEREAHVLEPLADDHSSDSDDAPTGVEESSAPAVVSGLPLLQREQP